MSRSVVAYSLVFVLLFGGNAFGINLLNFGEFGLSVSDYKKIDSFVGENGETIKPSRRDACLYEIKLEITANKSGEFGLYPAMFGALFEYRGLAQIVPAVALGTKITDRVTGDQQEYWYSEPSVSIILGVSKGEKFVKYIVLEVPKEVVEFTVQGPTSIQMLRGTR